MFVFDDLIAAVVIALSSRIILHKISQKLSALNRIKGKKVAVLGMKGAGKTRFYSFLKGDTYIEGESGVYNQTDQEHYDQFTYRKSDGTEILISDGYDIGGGDDYIPLWYKKMIGESDTIVFVFDLNAYFKDENSYRSNTRARLDFIWTNLGNNLEEKEMLTLLTHIDEIGKNYQKAIGVFKDDIKCKPYCSMVERNYASINMTDPELLRTLENKIFK